ncbi:MAG: LysR family transcriptional regulator [gamma proteobacterium symbiont of Lucinoma myriamae]|nr:LysR family transcriptional regulator [gamma proteobacterium symbiont of Lucinoma myriamae]MCU7817749.1 LysR family transcriptional regulator [gamma proteobacterium symbiont of Lucinoma myriamae]MCU7831732.1 LysR family transcriptional regulator [gamma proteobacterium symbiont of Lucinoma myriamae]
MDRFEEMKTFVTVVSKGSLSGAADKLDIAKSAISRRLAELEQRLDVQLINRTTRRLNLTESGVKFYQYCQHILADVAEAEQVISSEDAQLKGSIRIVAPLSFGIKHLSPVMNDFLKEHPALQLDMNLNDRMVNLIEEGVDLAIRIGNLEDSSYKARKLAPVKALVCASPDYLQEYGTPKIPGDLKYHNGLTYSNVSEGKLWQFVEPNGKLVSVAVPHRMRANNGDMLLQAAIDGLGIIFSPDFICYEAIKQGKLIPVLSEYVLSEVSLYAVYPDQRHLPQRVRLFIDYLVRRFGDKPYWNISPDKGA